MRTIFVFMSEGLSSACSHDVITRANAHLSRLGSGNLGLNNDGMRDGNVGGEAGSPGEHGQPRRAVCAAERLPAFFARDPDRPLVRDERRVTRYGPVGCVPVDGESKEKRRRWEEHGGRMGGEDRGRQSVPV